MRPIGPLVAVVVVMVIALASAATINDGFMVLGPKFFRSNQNYTLVMSNFYSRSKVIDVKLQMLGHNRDGTVIWRVPGQAAVQPNSNSVVNFAVPRGLPQANYELTVSVSQDASLNRVIPLVYRDNALSALIQLSKPVYKPGDSVRFRVIVLDSNLRPPAHVPTVRVRVKDPDDNVIRQWSRGRLHVGVFESQLQLSPLPILGEYSIHVEADAEELVSKAFDVKEYVLASFEVNVAATVPPLVVDQQLQLTVTARYYTGQPAEGTAKVELYLEDGVLDQYKTVPVVGQARVDLRFNTHFAMQQDEEDVRVVVTFTHLHTNQTVKKEAGITVYKYPYRVTLTKPQPRFAEGVPFLCTVRVEQHDGTRAKRVPFVVEVSEISHKGSTNTSEQLYTTDTDGLIALPLHPSRSAETIQIVVKSDNEDIFAESVSHTATGRAFIQAGPAVYTNASVEITIKCNERLAFFTYYVVARGNIIDSGFVRPEQVTAYKLQLNRSDQMQPHAKVVVLTVQNNVVLHDIVDVVFDELRNNFNLQLKKQEIRPGGEVELRLTGSPGAYVALAAYDKSLLQHGVRHDLFWEDIIKTFNGFHATSENEFDIFHSIGLFARASFDVVFPFATEQWSRSPLRTMKRAGQLVTMRTNFLESWLWQNLTIGQRGESVVQQNAPDSTTAWQLTGFSIDPMLGLGIVRRPLEFITSQPVYVADMLPYSIKRGEIVVLRFIIFNNLEDGLSPQVTLYNTDKQFELIASPAAAAKVIKIVPVAAKSSQPVSFIVKPLRLGEVVVRVTAESQHDVDTIERVIRVEPESMLQRHRTPFFFSHDEYITRTYEMKLPVAREADAGSQKMQLSLSTNLLTSVVQNLENLLSVPTGCGEQNMVRLVPNIVVLGYLSTSGSKNQQVIAKATNLLRQGYQQQLKYRQADGSFGVWRHSKSSVFLTAFVAKSFQAASRYLDEIKSGQVSQAYDWLASKQHSTGRFDEIGDVIHKDMQGGLRNGIALTAYVLSAFLEDSAIADKHTKVIDRGIQYLTDKLKDTVDLYDLSIATYALMLRGHSLKDAFLQKLVSKGKVQNNGTEMFWERSTGNIETTAYALLSIVQAKMYVTGTSVMRWLAKQQYTTGSFPRTQDTFVGLRALTQLTEKISPSKNDLSVELRLGNVTREFRIDGKELSYATHDESVEGVRMIEAKVAGMGFGLMELSYEYSVDLRNLSNRFDLQLKKTLSNDGLKLELQVCVSFIPQQADSLSNMALVEVNFPSGYVVQRNPISNASTANRIQKTEILHGATSVVVYYNNMGTERNCFTVTAFRQAKVALKRPAYVLVHDYYEPDLRALQVYEVDSLDICDICDREDCPPRCTGN